MFVAGCQSGCVFETSFSERVMSISDFEIFVVGIIIL